MGNGFDELSSLVLVWCVWMVSWFDQNMRHAWPIMMYVNYHVCAWKRIRIPLVADHETGNLLSELDASGVANSLLMQCVGPFLVLYVDLSCDFLQVHFLRPPGLGVDDRRRKIAHRHRFTWVKRQRVMVRW